MLCKSIVCCAGESGSAPAVNRPVRLHANEYSNRLEPEEHALLELIDAADDEADDQADDQEGVEDGSRSTRRRRDFHFA
jgi:hypothetical protein